METLLTRTPFTVSLTFGSILYILHGSNLTIFSLNKAYFKVAKPPKERENA